MRDFVQALCAPECAGRAPGTPGGAAARALIISALRVTGLDPFEQRVPGCGGANVLAKIPGEVDRWILIGAHHDHLGTSGGQVYWGADDNAAAVASLLEVAKQLAARRSRGRGVIFASFDGEEPPYFLTAAMGSEHFARHPIVSLSQIDLIDDLHGSGRSSSGQRRPAGRGHSVAGCPRSRAQHWYRGSARRPGGCRTWGHPAPLDAEVVPPLSDYDPFFRRGIPFLFLSAGRSRRYHTPQDTPEGLDW